MFIIIGTWVSPYCETEVLERKKQRNPDRKCAICCSNDRVVVEIVPPPKSYQIFKEYSYAIHGKLPMNAQVSTWKFPSRNGIPNLMLIYKKQLLQNVWLSNTFQRVWTRTMYGDKQLLKNWSQIQERWQISVIHLLIF